MFDGKSASGSSSKVAISDGYVKRVRHLWFGNELIYSRFPFGDHLLKDYEAMHCSKIIINSGFNSNGTKEIKPLVIH